MKKLLPLILVLILLLGLAACKGKLPPDPDETAPAAELDSSTEPDGDNPPATEIVLKNLVLADDDVCTFKINSIDPDGAEGYTIDAYIENKMGISLVFTIEDASINGYMCSPYWAEQVEANSSMDTHLRWYKSDLSMNAISAVKELEFSLRVYRIGIAEDFFRETFTLHPYGETVQAFAAEAREPAPDEIVLLDNDKFFFSITKFNAESAFDYAIAVYAENKLEGDVFFTFDSASVNRQKCNPYWAISLPAGKRANSLAGWLEEDFKALGITDVTELSFVLSIYDPTDWTLPPLFSGSFTVQPS